LAAEISGFKGGKVMLREADLVAQLERAEASMLYGWLNWCFYKLRRYLKLGGKDGVLLVGLPGCSEWFLDMMFEKLCRQYPTLLIRKVSGLESVGVVDFLSGNKGLTRVVLLRDVLGDEGVLMLGEWFRVLDGLSNNMGLQSVGLVLMCVREVLRDFEYRNRVLTGLELRKSSGVVENKGLSEDGVV
jgi:hypothetical protein